MEFDSATAEPVAAQSGFDPGSAEPVEEGAAKSSDANPFAINEAEFRSASPLGRLKMMLSHPWDKYAASVDQGWKGAQIPRLEADAGPGAENRLKQVGAGATNVASGVAGGVVSPGAVVAAMSPPTLIYSAPRFIVGGISDIIDAVKGSVSGKAGVQETVEKGAGGILMLAGAKVGLGHATPGLRGLASEQAPKTPGEAIAKIKEAAETIPDPEAKAALAAATEKIAESADNGVKFDAQSAVPLGPRDESVSTGTGQATPHEAAMITEWKKAIAEETGGAVNFDLAAPENAKIPEEPAGQKAAPAEPAAGEPSTYGIAERVSDARAKEGNIAPVEPGEGISPQESIDRGRSLISEGRDPQAAIDDFVKTGKISSDDIAVARARGEQLAKAAADAEEKFGIDSPEYKTAAEADSNWVKAIKPMQTEWHKIGQAQQGETEIDTGTFHGLRRAHLEATGKDFTPDQAKEAKDLSGKVAKATEEAAAATKKTLEQITKPEADSKKAPAPGSVEDIWTRAKAYVDGGETDYDAIRHKLATDLGIPVEEVTKKLTEPKGARQTTNEMYAKLAARRQMVSNAKNWLRDQQMPGWLKFIRAIPRAFFIDKVFGHGTVGMITHAGLNIFHPEAWRTYWPNFFRQYKLLGLHDKGAYHEMMMQDLVRDPNYVTARRAGLANDPSVFSDDYQNTWLGARLKNLGLTGNRGFDALKLFRQARFNQIWDAMPESIKTGDNAKLVADSINHATGTVRMKFREWSNWTFFAPKLEGSRWAWMIGDPAKAAKTFSAWDRATPGERAFAMRELKQKAHMAGVYLGLLAVNQGLLSAFGSSQKINVTDPRKSDFLAFKGGGFKFGVIAPLIGTVRLLASLIHASAGKRKGLEATSGRGEEMGQIAEQYFRGKLSPFAGFVTDVATQADFQKRPLPFSNDKVPAYLRREGVKKYTYAEYLSETFTPIPVSEAVKEVWAKQGMDESTIAHWLKALAVAGVMGGTGARMSKDYAVNPPASPSSRR